MKHHLSILLVVLGLLVCGGITVAFVSTEEAQSDEEKNTISESVFYAKEASLAATEVFAEQVVEYDTVNVEKNAEEALMNEALNEKYSEIDTYYCGNLAAVYKSHAKDAIAREFDPTYERPEGVTKEIKVRSGVLDFQVTNCAMNEDSAVVSSEYIVWCAFIEEVVPEKEYLLSMPMSFLRDEDRLIFENGQWKINESISHVQEFAPESYDPVVGTYDSLEEAVSAAENLDPVARNPF